MSQYTWPDSFLLLPLAGFLRVHLDLDCGIRWPCFPGLTYWRLSCSCGCRESPAWTFLISRGQAHPSIIECLLVTNGLCRHSLLHSFVSNANLMSAFSPAITMPRALKFPTLGRLLVPGQTGEQPIRPRGSRGCNRRGESGHWP